MSKKTRTSTCQAAKGAGLMDQLSLCRKHMAVLFGLATQAAPVTLTIFDLPSAWDGHVAPANAAGSFRSALSAEAKASGFLKPTRRLTEHRKILYPAH